VSSKAIFIKSYIGVVVGFGNKAVKGVIAIRMSQEFNEQNLEAQQQLQAA
jgi:hypothetical protein